MNAKVREYNAIKAERAGIARRNASLRMAGKSDLCIELPELPEKPCKWVLTESDGTYAGTEWDEETALELAETHNLSIRKMPFDKTA